MFSGILVNAQNKKTEKILEEGKMLYRMEKASWYGTDLFFEHFPYFSEQIGGYVSYQNEQQKIITVFYDRNNPENILVRFIFDHLPSVNSFETDTMNQKVTDLEKDLIALRNDAKNRLYKNEDEFFKYYQNTSFNLIPLVQGKNKRVIVLTGPQMSGVVLLGNDYVLNYDKNNQFKSKEKLHESIIEYPYQSDDKENPLEATLHTHILDDYITSTDICTLLLYKEFLEWKKHFVIGQKTVSIFDMETESLFTMKKKDWEKIRNHQK